MKKKRKCPECGCPTERISEEHTSVFEDSPISKGQWKTKFTIIYFCSYCEEEYILRKTESKKFRLYPRNPTSLDIMEGNFHPVFNNLDF